MKPLVYIAIGGEPAVGKSTLTKAYIKHVRAREFASGFAVWRQAQGFLCIPKDGPRYLFLGKWLAGDKFPGPDRLSMSVQPDALYLISSFYIECIERSEAGVVVADGDRLYNGKMFRAVEDMRPQVALHNVVLEAPEALVRKRHKAREDKQTARFIRGRRTKAQNLEAAYPTQTRRFEHTNPTQTQGVIAYCETLTGSALAAEEPV